MDRHPYLVLTITVLVAGGVLICAAHRAFAEYNGPPASVETAREYFIAGQHDLAEEMLRRILVHDPDNREALILLGQILGQGGRKKEASGYLKRALYLDPDDPRTNLELGKNFMERDVPSEAEDFFERAKQLAVTADPALTAEATGYLEQLQEARQKGEGEFHLNVLAGLQHDTNVVAFSDDVFAIAGAAREDLRATLNLSARYVRPLGGDREGVAGYAFYKSQYDDLGMYDTDLHMITLKGAGKLNAHVVDLRYIYEYAVMDGYRHSMTHGISPSLVLPVHGDGSIILTYRYKDIEARDLPVSPLHSGASGHSHLTGLTVLMTLPGEVKARAGYLYEDRDAVEGSFAYTGHKAYMDAGYRLGLSMRATGYGEYHKKDYSNAAPVGRVESKKTLSATLMRDFSKRSSALLSYTYVWNGSDDWRYEYERAVASLLMKVRY